MAIITPDYRDLQLDQRRSSAISPADTYYRPEQPDTQRSKNADMFARAAESLGSSLANLGQTLTAEMEKDSLLAVDQKAEEALRQEARDGVSRAAQVDAVVGDMSATGRARVNEAVANRDADTWWNARAEKFWESGDWRDPGKTQAFIDGVFKDSESSVLGQGFYGGSFGKRVRDHVSAFQNQAMSMRIQEDQKLIDEDFASGSLKAGDEAYKGPSTPPTAYPEIKAMKDGKPVYGPPAPKETTSAGLGTPQAVENKVNEVAPKLKNEECVTLVKGVCGDERSVREWRRGAGITEGDLTPGTPIATFLDRSGKLSDKYDGGQGVGAPGNNTTHAAVFNRYVTDGSGKRIGIEVWEQYNGTKPHLQTYKFGDERGGEKDAANYYVINDTKGNVIGKAGGQVGGGGAQSVAGSVDTVVNKIIGHESGGNPTAQSANTSAGGLGQFVDGTWLSTVRKYAPEYAGKSDAEILALKKDASPEGVAFQKRMLTEFTKANAVAVASTGAPVTPGNIYLMHFAGEGDGKKILKAADQTPIESVMDAESIAKNPHLHGKTVGEVKQWAAGVMGQSYDRIGAAKNALRAYDREHSVGGRGLDNIRRRDAIIKSHVEMAVKLGDTSYLDRIPDEWASVPKYEAEIAQARRQAEAVQDHNYERKRRLEAWERADTSRKLIEDMMDKRLRGEPINPYTDTRRPDNTVDDDAYKFALSDQRTSFIPEEQSMANRISYTDLIETAAAGGDWSKVIDGWDGKTVPTANDLRKLVLERDDMRTEDKKYLLGKMDNIIKLGHVADSPDAKRVFNSRVLTYAEVQMNAMLPKLQNGIAQNPIDFKGEAAKVFNETVRSLTKSEIERTGQMPGDTYAIYERAAEVAKQHVKDLADTLKSGGKQEGKPDAKPAANANATSKTIKFADLPPNTPIRHVAGRAFVQIGNEFKDVVDEPKEAKPVEKPAELTISRKDIPNWQAEQNAGKFIKSDSGKVHYTVTNPSGETKTYTVID